MDEKGERSMKKKNPYSGSSFDSFLDEEDLKEEVVARVAKKIFVQQLEKIMKSKGINKSFLRRFLKSPSTTERLLSSEYTGTSLETMSRAAALLGCEIEIQLVDSSKKTKKAA